MAAAGVGVLEVVEVVVSVFTFPNPINRAPGPIAGSIEDVVDDEADVDVVVGVDAVVGVVTTTRFSVGDGPGRSIP
jgi:hypothetical protein